MKTYKLLKAEQIKKWDTQTMIIQNITSEALMERAANKIYKKLIKNEKKLLEKYSTFIFCGVGNNGGDGLVLARLLHQSGYDVSCVIVPFSRNTSSDFDKNLHKIMEMDIPVKTFTDKTHIPKNTLIIDAIFGTGLSRPASGIAELAIETINHSKAKKIISIDIPSGLFVDKENDKNDKIIKSDIVYTIELPKLSFFFPSNIKYVPEYKIVKIGLDKSFLKNLQTDKFVYKINVKKTLSRPDDAYKNIFGHALIIAGSYGMVGAGILASKATLRIGAGLVTAFMPECAYIPVQSAVPEVMIVTDKNKKYITKIKLKNDYDAIGIGPGLGKNPKTQKTVLNFIKNYEKPMLIDADTLNILAENRKYLSKIPENSILTPHLGEFKRLIGKPWKNDNEKIKLAKSFASKYKTILVLKGAYSIVTDGKNVYINPFANSALATAGSGDVLSGIITGLLAQGFSPLKAALSGVQIHTKASQLFDDDIYNKSSMIASDTIKDLMYL